jgi:hypothetical protein
MRLLLSVVRDVRRLWLVFFQGILGDDEGLVVVDAVGGLMHLYNGSEETVA